MLSKNECVMFHWNLGNYSTTPCGLLPRPIHLRTSVAWCTLVFIERRTYFEMVTFQHVASHSHYFPLIVTKLWDENINSKVTVLPNQWTVTVARSFVKTLLATSARIAWHIQSTAPMQDCSSTLQSWPKKHHIGGPNVKHIEPGGPRDH